MSHREVVQDAYLNHRQPEHDHFLFEGVDYPATKQELVDFASDTAIDADTMNLVRSLPDRTFENRDDVWRGWSEAMRVFGGAGGEPRDNMGKQKTDPGGEEVEL